MARQIGMRTVAEGVENLADWTLLRSLGCDLAQGDFVAKPMPFAMLSSWEAGWAQRRPTLTVSAV